MSVIENLKKARTRAFEQTKTMTENSGGKKTFVKKFWSPEMAKDTESVTSVTIRFLPSKDPDDVSCVSMYEHFFKGDDNRWLQTLCPTTYGESCSVNG